MARHRGRPPPFPTNRPPWPAHRYSPNEATHRLVPGLALLDLAIEVGATGAVPHADLGDRDQVESRVELAVTASGEPMHDALTARRLDRSGAGVARERVGAAEPRRATCPTEQPHSEDGTDAIDVEEAAPVGLESVGHLLGDLHELRIQRADVADEIPRQRLPRVSGRRRRSNRSQRCRRGLRGQSGPSSTSDEIAHERVELVDRPDPLGSQVCSTFLQQREHGRLVIGGGDHSVALERSHARGSGCVDHVVLATTTA